MGTFRNVLVFSLVAFTSAWSATATSAMLKQQSRKEFGLGRYRQAIDFARQATEADPTDAEAWYLRGWSLHYLCFDSRPLSGQTRATTDSVISFLEKATSLDPKLGDAYYSIGACYGMLVLDELGEGNVKQAVADLRAARTHGGFPDWVLEYDRQILKQCAPNAILLDGGDLVVAGIAYLQLVEHERPDVSAFFAQITHGPWGLTAKYGSRARLRRRQSVGAVSSFFPCTRTSGRPTPCSFRSARKRSRVWVSPGRTRCSSGK